MQKQIAEVVKNLMEQDQLITSANLVKAQIPELAEKEIADRRICSVLRNQLGLRF